MEKAKLSQLVDSVKDKGIETRGGQVIRLEDLEFVVAEGRIGRAKRYPQIGITGWSGGGKTTTAEFLAQVLGFTAFEGDNILFHGFSDPRYEEQTKKIFNIKDKNRLPQPGDDVKKFAYENYLPLDEQKETDFFVLMRPYVVEQLKFAYSNATTDFASHPILKDALLHQPRDPNGKVTEPNGFVAEMCGYHQADILRRRPKIGGAVEDGVPTDFLALVFNMTEHERREQLDKRGNMQPFKQAGKFDEIVGIREKVQRKLLAGLSPDSYVCNEYDDASLVRAVEQIIKMMMSEGVAKLKKENGIWQYEKTNGLILPNAPVRDGDAKILLR